MQYRPKKRGKFGRGAPSSRLETGKRLTRERSTTGKRRRGRERRGRSGRSEPVKDPGFQGDGFGDELSCALSHPSIK